MDTAVLPTAADAGAHAAALIAGRLRAAIAERGQATVALSGGRTPEPMLAAMRSWSMRWRSVHVFQTDERIVADDDERSNLKALRAALRGTGLPPEHLHRMLAGTAAPVPAIAEYEQSLRAVAGTPPVLDVVHLGLGTDGHTASLFPGDRALDAAGEVVLSGPRAGLGRVTLSLHAINRARSRIWLVTGAGKRDVVRRFLAFDPALVASRVRREDATIVLDRSAAA